MLLLVTAIIMVMMVYHTCRLLQDVAMLYQVEKWPKILSEILTRLLRLVLSAKIYICDCDVKADCYSLFCDNEIFPIKTVVN